MRRRFCRSSRIAAARALELYVPDMRALAADRFCGCWAVTLRQPTVTMARLASPTVDCVILMCLTLTLKDG